MRAGTGKAGKTVNIILFEEGTDFFPGTDERCIHLRKVLHKTAGDTFAAGVVNGPSGTARITEITVQGVRFSFQPEQPFLPPDPVWLLVGFPRPIQLKRLLRAAASLGVSGILLCGTDLGEKSYRQSGVLARGTARAAVLDGAMQSGYTAVPEIAEQETLDAALNAVQTRFPAAAKIVLDVAQDGVRPPELAQVQPGPLSAAAPLVLAVGSERGWTARERALFAADGWQPAGLGRRILRTETAAVAACAVAASAFGFWRAR